MNFYLIGMMATGKSYFGKRWAAEHQLSFLDLDEKIVAEYGAPITTIFAEEGEGFFREMEKIVLQQTAVLINSVVACGGGTACFHNNIDWMKEHGIVIWLNASVADILENLKTDQLTRPLLLDISPSELEENVRKHLQQRTLHYQKANYEISNFADADNIFKLIYERNS